MAEPYKDVSEALNARDAEGVLCFLRSAGGEDALSDCKFEALMAAEYGDTDCLWVLDMCGVELLPSSWVEAACHGQVDCLAFAVSRGYTLDDYVLEVAVEYGQLACVDFLIRHGLPHKPFKHPVGRGKRRKWHCRRTREKGCVTPGMLKCWQLMADRGVDICPWSMEAAVASGDLDFVRWLHQHGVPLWTHAIQDKIPSRRKVLWRSDATLACNPVTVLIPARRESVEDIWKALHYGGVKGAPTTPLVEEVFNAKRLRSRTVLMCFKVVERECTAALPSALVEEILVLADLEIRESMLAPGIGEAPLP